MLIQHIETVAWRVPCACGRLTLTNFTGVFKLHYHANKLSFQRFTLLTSDTRNKRIDRPTRITSQTVSIFQADIQCVLKKHRQYLVCCAGRQTDHCSRRNPCPETHDLGAVGRRSLWTNVSKFVSFRFGVLIQQVCNPLAIGRLWYTCAESPQRYRSKPMDW